MAEEARLNSRGILDLVNGFHLFQYSVMEKIAAKCSDYFAVCSESFRDYYVGKGVDSERIEVILNGVNIDLFKPRDVRKKDVFTVTYAGRFQKWQGIDLLLEAAQAAEGRGREVQGHRDRPRRRARPWRGSTITWSSWTS